MGHHSHKFLSSSTQDLIPQKIHHIPIHHHHYNNPDSSRSYGIHPGRFPILLGFQISRRFITPIITQFITIRRNIQVIDFTIITINTNPKCPFVHTFQMKHINIFQYNFIRIFSKTAHFNTSFTST